MCLRRTRFTELISQLLLLLLAIAEHELCVHFFPFYEHYTGSINRQTLCGKDEKAKELRYVYVCACVCVYTYIYIYTYIHIFIIEIF